MCGIAGLIHRKGSGNIGQEMTQMLQSLKHRGPDSTGYAIYGTPGRNEYVMMARELLIKFQMSPNHPMVQLNKAYRKVG